MGKAKEIAELGDKITVSGGTVTVADISTATFSGTSIHSMQDVDLTGIAHNMFLKYNLSNTQFEVVAGNTSSIDEGSNLYYTDARVASYLSSNDFDTATNIVASITDSAPSTLDTLNELAAALGDDANFSTTVTNSIATKLPLAGGTLTGTLTVTGANTHLDGRNSAGLTLDLSGTGHYTIKESTTNDIVKLGGTGTSNFIAHNISSGNVGIGTDSPNTKLHVDGNGSAVELRVAQNGTYYTDIGINHIDVYNNDLRIMMGGSEKWRFKSGGDLYASGAQEVKSGDKSAIGYEAFFGANSLRFNRDGDSYIDTRGTNNNLKFRHNSNYDIAMTILGSNGNVGIGTTSPGKLLTLSRETEAQNEQLEFRTVGGISNGNFDGIKWTQGATGGTMLAEQRINYYDTGVVDMSFNLRNEDNVLYLKAGGNVGIGTTSPGAKLHVNGASARVQVSDTGTSFTAQDFLSNSNAVRATIGVERSSGGGLFVGSSAYAAVFGTASNGATQFATNNNVRMTLDTSGNVSIGTTTPYVGGVTGNGRLNVYHQTAGQWAIQGRSDVVGANGLFIRAGDSVSDTTALFTGRDENDVHMKIRADGYIGLATTSLNSHLTMGKLTTSKTDGKSIRTYRSYGDAGRPNHSRIISYGYNTGYNQYTYHRIILGGGIYGDGATVKYKFIATTGHASGHGYVEGIISLRAHHSTGKMDAGDRHTVICRHSVGGSYYGWTGSPDVTMFESSNTNSNAAIIMRCEGHVNANSGSFDGVTQHTIHLEILGSDYNASQRMEFIGHSAPSDIGSSFSRSLLSQIV